MKYFFINITIVIFTILACLSLFELSYRYQIFDFYQPELQAYNLKNIESDTRGTILCMGDSFTAGGRSYPAMLRELLPQYNVVNSGLSGTSVIQSEYLARKRFNQFKPKILIYQIYLGNDLSDIRHPKSNVSIQRAIYWSLSEKFRSIAYLNYRLVSVKFWYEKLRNWSRATPKTPEIVFRSKSDDVKAHNMYDTSFDPRRYPYRAKLLLNAEPFLLENQINVSPAREADYRVFEHKLDKITQRCHPGECRVFILIIPHASQVHPKYVSRLEQVGAKFRAPEQLFKSPSKFVEKVTVFSKGRNITVLDPLVKLQESERVGNSVYFLHDPHLNHHGQSILANYLFKEIELTLN